MRLDINKKGFEMRNNCYERLKNVEKAVKKSYRRWRNKLSPEEHRGYKCFEKLVFEVGAAERFLVGGKALEACFEEHEFGVKDRNGKITIRNGHLIDPLLEAFVDLNFTLCAAVSGEVFEFKNLDLFLIFSKDDMGRKLVQAYGVDTCLEKVSSSCSDFREYLSQVVPNYTCVSFEEDMVYVSYLIQQGDDPKNRLAAVTTVAAHMSNLILERSEAEMRGRYARISDCDYVRGPNGRYEAHNYYTYICDQSDAQQFRNSVREKRQAHEFTGTGGTKAFHFRKAHWRYYQELDKDVFVRGYYAGRHKPEVNVIR